MFLMVRGGNVVGRRSVTRADLLACGGTIVAVAPRLRVPDDWPVRIVEADGRLVTPGLIDLHLHLAGGGGEAGFGSRTTGADAADLLAAGITTAVGCLGTDDVTRSTENLLATVYQLRAKGLCAFCYAGSYHLPPQTLTGSLRKDIALIEPLVGVGEVAIADHRACPPTDEQLVQLAAEVRLGAMLAAKPGLVHFHVGAAPEGLAPLLRLARAHPALMAHLLPTHVSRSYRLLDQAAAFARMGGCIDVTAGGQRISTTQAVSHLLERGVEPERITLSSDGYGSLPQYDAQGMLQDYQVASPCRLLADMAELAQGPLSVPQALALATLHPALRLGLAHRKGTLEPGKDADVLVVSDHWQVETVICGGAILYENGRPTRPATAEAPTR